MIVTVALLQQTAAGRDLDANLERGLRACRDAKAMGADIALFPEMWSIGYDLHEGQSPEELIFVPNAGDAYRKPSTYGPIVREDVRPPFTRPDARR